MNGLRVSDAYLRASPSTSGDRPAKDRLWDVLFYLLTPGRSKES